MTPFFRPLGLLTGLLLSLSAVASESAPDFDLANDSHLWPERVGLREPLSLPDGKLISNRFPGMLIRVEGSDVLIDFGRDGRRRLPVEATDIIERATDIKANGRKDFWPNFWQEIGPRLVFGREGVWSGVPPEEFLEAYLVAVIYTDVAAFDQEGAPAAIVQFCRAAMADGVYPIFFPLNTDLLERLDETWMGIAMPTPHFLAPMLGSLWHSPSRPFEVVVVDPFGKLELRSAMPADGTVAAVLEDLLPPLKAAVEGKPARRTRMLTPHDDFRRHAK